MINCQILNRTRFYLAVIFLFIQSRMPGHHHFTKLQFVTLCIEVLNGLHWTVAIQALHSSSTESCPHSTILLTE